MTGNTALVLVDHQDGVSTVTLNRPDNLNALSIGLRTELIRTFQALRDNLETRVVILTGSGRAFCAGLDLKELGQKGLRSGPAGADLQSAIEGLGKPLIGAINGFAVTGGFELALMCDILVASESARFADTHVRMGVVPGWGLSQKLARLVGVSRAKELSFTGNYLDAETAERWGLVNRVLKDADLLPHCEAMARTICEGEPSTLKAIHELIDYGWNQTLEAGLAEEQLRTREQGADISAAALEERRHAVQARGRSQD